MYYCSSCGEAGDGRFCRMCGTALSPITEPAQPQQLSAVAAAQMSGQGPGPGPEFDSLFRSEDGSYRSTDRTQLLPPAVQADYRMAPPGTSVLPPYDTSGTFPQQTAQYTQYTQPGVDYPPPPNDYSGGGYEDGWPPQAEEDPEGPRRGVIYGTLGAVGVAIAVIIALLYFGTPGQTKAPASTGGQLSAPTSQPGSDSLGQLQLPSGLPVPTITPPAPATTAPPPTPTASARSRGNSALPLSLGSTGSLVKYVQQRLHQLGFYNGPANGDFDQSTAVAVQRFQAQAQVQGDPASTVGRSTMTALVAAGSQPTLRLGAGGSSADVKRLQEALDYAENADLPVNGKYDAATWTAVTKYQTAVGLQPTGQTNSQTWDKLQSGVLG